MSKIPFLNHLDLLDVSELQNAILHKTTSGTASAAEGKIIYDTGTDTIKFYNGDSWLELSSGDSNTTYDLAVKQTSGNNNNPAIRLTGSDNSTDNVQITGGTNITVTRNSDTQLTIDAGAATTVGKTNSTQRSGSIELIAGSNVTITEDGTTGHFTFAATDTNTQLTQEQVEDFVGGLLAAGEGIDIEYDDGGGVLTISGEDADATNKGIASFSSSDFSTSSGAVSIKSGGVSNSQLANSSITINGTAISLGGSVTTPDTNTDTLQSIADSSSSSEQFVTFVANASGAQTGLSDAAFKYIPSSGTLKVTNLIVSGDTTTANETIKVVTDNTLQFEGASGTSDDHELDLTTAVLGGDRTVTLADLSGHVALFAAAPTATISATPAELNQLDDVTVGGTSAGDIVTINGSQTLTNKTISASQVTQISNLTAAEGAQLENINSVTISNTQWGYLGALNQGLTTTSDAAFNSLDIAGDVDVDGTLEADAITVNGSTLNSVIDGRITGREFKGNFPATATSAGATITIQHDLGTRDVIVQFYANVADITGDGSGDVTQYEEVKLSTTRATINTVTVQPNIALDGSALRVLIKEL